jgi:hypothetical protein
MGEIDKDILERMPKAWRFLVRFWEERREDYEDDRKSDD